MIATTYCSTIVKTQVFCLYSLQWIYGSLKLPIYTRYIWTGRSRCLKAIRGAPEDDDGVNSDIHFEVVIVGTWRCTWKPASSEFGDALEGLGRAGLEMHLEAEIYWNSEMHMEGMTERVLKCSWRPQSWNTERHLEAMIERVGRCTCRPWSIGIQGVLGGGWSWGGRSVGRCDSSWDSIHWCTHNCGNVESWVQYSPQRDERLAGSGRQFILGWCCTRCMLYSVYAVLIITYNHCIEIYIGITELCILRWW
jgi:hypothetical protein